VIGRATLALKCLRPPSLQDDGSDECEDIGKMLVRLTQELDAQMLFLVNYSDSNLKDFLNHSITGQCLQSRTCPSVVLHTKGPSGSSDDLSG